MALEADVHFKLEYSVSSLRLTPTSKHHPVEYPIRFEYGGPHGLLVTVRPPDEAEVKLGHDPDSGLCEAISEVGPLPQIVAMFAELATGRLPAGSQPDREAGYWDADGERLRENHLPPRSILPTPLRDFLGDVERELRDYLTRTIRVMRWRLNAEGPHSPFSHRGAFWSADGQTWHRLPEDITADLWTIGSLSLRGGSFEDVRALVASGGDEPFEHELLREAWLQRRENPRSALLLGVAAAEVGIKSHIGFVLPGAAWLVRELPAPPIVRLYGEYLPTLPTGRVFGGDVTMPPTDLIETLRKGVRLRNDLAHKGAVSIPRDGVERLLEAIDDLLWLLQYLRGSDWALDHISEPSRVALGLSSRALTRG